MFCIQTKGKLLDFYKERAQQFYDGHVEEVNFSAIGDLVRQRTNLLIKRQTHGKVPEYLRSSNILLRPPLAVFSANIFQVRTLVKVGCTCHKCESDWHHIIYDTIILSSTVQLCVTVFLSLIACHLLLLGGCNENVFNLLSSGM
jgi:hypothetical protein